MSGTLYLHIGTHKTGSTALQDHLYRHRDALAELGLVYPDLGQARPGHHELAWACGSSRQHPPDEHLVARTGEALARTLQSGADVVLSSEEFEYLTDMPRLAPLLAAGPVKVVLYVRRQDEMLLSVYAQHVAMYNLRFEGSIYQFSHGRNFQQRFNYHWLATRWARVVGNDNLVLRPYGTALVDGDTCADLLTVIGNRRALDHYGARPPALANPSHSAQALRLLAHLNRLTLTREQHRRLLPHLRKRWPPDDRFSLLRPAEATAFYERFRLSNVALFEEFLGLDRVPFDAQAGAPADVTWLIHEQVDSRELLDTINIIINPQGEQHGDHPG